ncbi:MAG: VWA domain-containing protein [Pseudomonadota bacterium]
MFSFVNPWWFLLLLVPYFVYWFFPQAKLNLAHAIRVPFFATVAELNKQHKLQTNLPWKSMLLGYLIWLLIVTAIAGPQWLGKPIIIPQRGRDIILAIDLSGSMRIPDMSLNGRRVDRLTVVKNAAQHFINSRLGDKIGLILFGSKAYVQTPLTFDRKTVMAMLNDATVGLAGTQTAIGDAIGLGIKQLINRPGKAKVIILLTDGGNNSGQVGPLAAAKVAAKYGIKIYTIGIGAKQMIVQGLFGPEIVKTTSQLDEKTLQQIAALTHAVFFRAENNADLNRVYQSLNKLEPIISKTNVFRSKKALYPWPLGLALILTLLIAGIKLFQDFQVNFKLQRSR